MLVSAAAYLLAAPLLGVWYSQLHSFEIQRGAQIVLLCLAALALLASPARALPVPRLTRPAVGALVAVLMLGLVSAAMAARPEYALREVASFSGLFLLALTVAAARIRLGSAMDRALLGCVWVGALLYLVLFLGLHFASPRDVSSFHELFPSFANPRFFSHLLTWTLPLMVVAAVPAADRTGARVPLLWAVAGGWWMLLIASGSRGSIAGLACATLVMAAWFGRGAASWLWGQAVALALGIASHSLLARASSFSQLGTVSERGISDNGRYEFWSHATGLLERSPWLGAGPAHFAFYRGDFTFPAAHPHNALLQWLSEWGIPSTMLLAALVLWALARWLRFARTPATDGSLLRIGISGSILAAGAHSLVCGVIVMPVSQTLGAVVVGWALGLYHSRREPNPEPHARGRVLVRGLAFAALLAMVATAGLKDVPFGNGAIRVPRFWLEGTIP